MEDGNKEEKVEEGICAGKPTLKLSGSQGKRKYNMVLSVFSKQLLQCGIVFIIHLEYPVE